MKLVATFEVDATEAEVLKFKELAKVLDKDFGTTYRLCANERADELLKAFKENLPPNGDDIESTGTGT